ncbi:MAG: ABC transporter ATP-binding protein [Acidimicrobiales bacterium]
MSAESQNARWTFSQPGRSDSTSEPDQAIAERDAKRPLLRVEALSAGYDGRPVVHGVSLDVSPGEVVSVVGPNGSGKSTLLKAIVGVVAVLSGHVSLGDTDLTNHKVEDIARCGVGYVPQVDDVFTPLTVKENLEMGGYLLPAPEVAARIGSVIEVFPRLGSMLARRASKLSGGERKMLAMGRVLMLRPAIFVLDEPTANLAPQVARSLLRDHVRSLAREGAGVLLVEQRARAALEISDHAYVLGGGQLRMEGTPAELADSEAFVDSFLGGVAASDQRGPLNTD